jgi:hypothetical protein
MIIKNALKCKAIISSVFIKYPKLYVIAILLVINCSTIYNVHITTIPAGDYDIYYDKNLYGIMPLNGDTTIQFPKISVFKTPIIELKGVDRYGCYQLGYCDSIRKIENVKSFKIKGYSIKNCDIVFNMDNSSHRNDSNQNSSGKIAIEEKLKNITFSQIHYCIADLRLLQKGMKAYDYDNTEYRIMKKYVELNMNKNGYIWDTVNSALTRRITLGLAVDTTNNPDSLPYAAWELATSQKIKYLVVFYGYSALESRGVAPGTAAASVALTTLGILVGINTGIYTIVYPTGKDLQTVMDSYCAIFSVNPNKCLYNAKVSITSFNNSNIENQLMGLYNQLFEKIKPLFNNVKEPAVVKENNTGNGKQ